MLARQLTQESCSLAREFSTSSIVYARRSFRKEEVSDHDNMVKFFGPKSITGEYHKNIYYYPNQNNRPNYFDPQATAVVGVRDGYQPSSRAKSSRNPSIHPFPHNIQTKTNLMLSDFLKDEIVRDVKENGLHVQEVAHKYGINQLRIEAILKLRTIEEEFSQDSTLDNQGKKDLQKFGEVMKRMFSLYEGGRNGDNLTEIPTPKKMLQQRFLTIAESQPFGPVDAAKILDLQPAADTLKELTRVKSQEEREQEESTKNQNVIYGREREGDSNVFKFILKEGEETGYRYGAARRDRKKDRKIGFDRSGKMVYLV
ncbi:37S ribosomal protein S35 mitochondrial [Spathaspora sp. JA1]|nr:37S ribosomal protein S35 mitochondrial [Spathaspora sp. JA1]